MGNSKGINVSSWSVSALETAKFAEQKLSAGYLLQFEPLTKKKDFPLQ